MSSVVRTATIGTEPVDLATMKNILKTPPQVTTDDAYISGLIRAARQIAETITEAVLVRSTFVQYHDHFPTSRVRDRGYSNGMVGHPMENGFRRHGEITLRKTPLISVEKLIFIGTDGLEYTLNAGQDFVVDPARQPGRIRPIPFTIWPLTLHTPNAIAVHFTAGYAPNTEGIAGGQVAIAEPETKTPTLNQAWRPTTVQPQYSFLIDPTGNVEVQITAGTPSTGAAPNPPTWPAIGATVADGGCTWQNFGPIRGFWAPAAAFAGNCVIVDYNNNLQLLIVPALISQPAPPQQAIDGEVGINGSQQPPWSRIVGGTTLDNAITAWRCLGTYNPLGNQLLSVPQSPEQQAAYVIDRTLPDTVWVAITQLVTHWYFNREPVAPGSVSTVPLHVEALLATVSVPDYSTCDH